MGLNQGIAKGHLIGLRVASPLESDVDITKRRVTYIPAYIRADGKPIRSLCKVTAFVNHKGSDKASLFTLSAWGKLADIFARGMSPGKEFYADVRIESYYANVYNKAGQKVLNPDGTDLQVLKHSYIVEDFLFGDDSKKYIDHEILNGKRPENWNDGAEGSAAWKAVLDRRNATQYQDGKATFGYAKVIKRTVTAAPQTTAGNLPNEVANAAGNAEALSKSFGNMNQGAAQGTTAGTDEDPF